MESHIKIIESDSKIMCQSSEGGEINFVSNLEANLEESEESDSGAYQQCEDDDDFKSVEPGSPLCTPRSVAGFIGRNTMYPDWRSRYLDDGHNYFTADSASEDENSDSESNHMPKFLEMSDFSDDEDLVQVDRIQFYEHMDSVTKKSWHLKLPERKRIIYTPFYTPADGSFILARVDTNLHFKKECQGTSTFYVSYLSIFNEIDDHITYMVRCSDPQNLIIKSPRTGSISPRGSVSVFMYFKDDPKFKKKLADEGVVVGLSTFNIIKSTKTGKLFLNKNSALKNIELKHFEDFWNVFGTEWFPYAEIHHVNNLTFSGQNFAQGSRKLEGITKNLEHLLHDEKISHLEKNLQFPNNVTASLIEDVRQLQAEMWDIQKKQKYNRLVRKIWNLVLCVTTLYLIMSPTNHVQNVMKFVFGFQELPQDKEIGWLWWWPW